MKLAVRSVTVPLRAPWEFGRGSIGERELLLVSLTADDGVTGYGEAAPLEPYDGVPLQAVRVALEDCREALAEADENHGDELLAECWRRAVLPQAVAAVDLALWDLAGRRAAQPVWALLGDSGPPQVTVNGTIAAPDRAGAASAAGALREAGFRCVKVKVGLGDDAGRLAAVRAVAGADVALRLDANGVWSVPEARAALRALAPVGIELCEEPVSGLEAFIALGAAGSPVAVGLDESSVIPGALEHRVCDAVCLKLARCGGITGLLDSARRARAAGYEVYLASTLDGPLGVAGALHAATVIGPDRPSGLATLAAFHRRPDPLPPHAGILTAPAAPGLGPAELLAWYG